MLDSFFLSYQQTVNNLRLFKKLLLSVSDDECLDIKNTFVIFSLLNHNRIWISTSCQMFILTAFMNLLIFFTNRITGCCLLFYTTVFKQIVSLLLSHVVQESCSVKHDIFRSTITKLDMFLCYGVLALWNVKVIKCG